MACVSPVASEREIVFTALKDPGAFSKQPVVIKETKVPFAEQTHEIIYEPESDAVYVSQMSDSVLVRIKVGPDGLLEDAHTAWRVGEAFDGRGIGGLHNVSLSPTRPGHLWVSLQYANLLLLLDVRGRDDAPRVVNRLHVPTRAATKGSSSSSSAERKGKDKIFGGPHVIREDPRTGAIWAGLKGEIPCCPNVPDEALYAEIEAVGAEAVAGDVVADDGDNAHPRKRPRKNNGGGCCETDKTTATTTQAWKKNKKPARVVQHLSKAFAKALDRDCCSITFARHHFAKHAELGYDAPTPNAFAVWHVDPEQYDRRKPEHGGTLYECLKSPPMCAIDADGCCWVAQDASPYALRIDPRASVARQIAVPFPATAASTKTRFTGPGCVAAPDGDVWFSLLGLNNAMLRFHPSAISKSDDGNDDISAPGLLTYYDFGAQPWARALPTVHCAFATIDTARLMLVITSDLIDDAGTNALEVIKFGGDDWTTVVGRRVIPLPTQDSAIHRVEVVHGDDPGLATAVVTELNSAKIFQIKLRHIVNFETLIEITHHVQRTSGPDTHQDIPAFDAFAYKSKSYIEAADAPGTAAGTGA